MKAFFLFIALFLASNALAAVCGPALREQRNAADFTIDEAKSRLGLTTPTERISRPYRQRADEIADFRNKTTERMSALQRMQTVQTIEFVRLYDHAFDFEGDQSSRIQKQALEVAKELRTTQEEISDLMKLDPQLQESYRPVNLSNASEAEIRTKLESVFKYVK